MIVEETLLIFVHTQSLIRTTVSKICNKFKLNINFTTKNNLENNKTKNLFTNRTKLYVYVSMSVHNKQ